MNVMLLAAGEGTRLRPYTEVLPKPAIPFLTVPLAAHALSFLHGYLDNSNGSHNADSKNLNLILNSDSSSSSQSNSCNIYKSSQPIEKLVVNTFHLPSKIHELFNQIPHGARSLHFSDEVGEILGGGGGLKKARQHFIGGGDFVMMNADEVILPKDPHVLKNAFEYHQTTKALATLMVMNHPGVGSQFGGVWADTKNKVLGFGKATIPESNGWHFVGVLILSEKIFDYIPTFGASNILYDVLTVAINEGELVQTFSFEGSWFETGNPEDFFKASEKCFQFLADPQNSYEKKFLKKTLNNFSSEPVNIGKKGDAKLVLSNSAQLDDSLILEGLIIAGTNSRISGPGYLKNVVINSNVNIPKGTNVTDTFVLKSL